MFVCDTCRRKVPPRFKINKVVIKRPNGQTAKELKCCNICIGQGVHNTLPPLGLQAQLGGERGELGRKLLWFKFGIILRPNDAKLLAITQS